MCRGERRSLDSVGGAALAQAAWVKFRWLVLLIASGNALAAEAQLTGQVRLCLNTTAAAFESRIPQRLPFPFQDALRSSHISSC